MCEIGNQYLIHSTAMKDWQTEANIWLNIAFLMGRLVDKAPPHSYA